jgi:hypothetical protein
MLVCLLYALCLEGFSGPGVDVVAAIWDCRSTLHTSITDLLGANEEVQYCAGRGQ